MKRTSKERAFFPRVGIKRVAMITVHTSPLAQPGIGSAGGMNVYIRELSRHLAQRGVEVDIFTRRDHPDHPPVIEPTPGVRVYALEAGPPTPQPKDQIFCYLPEFVSELAHTIYRDRRTYDVIHAHYWLAGWAAYLLQRYWNIPFIQMFHTLGVAKSAVRQARPESVLRLQVEQGLAQVANAVIAANPEERDTILHQLSGSAERTWTVPPGVDADHFRPLDRLAARARLGIASGQPVAIFVGRIDPVKGIEVLLQAWQQVTHQLHELRPLLLFLGGAVNTASDQSLAADSALQGVINEAKRLGIAQSIRFLGSRPQLDIPLFYNAADVCLMPSRYESFGLVAVESMACGTPVVASHVGGLRFTIEHGVSGLHVPPDDAQALAQATVRLLTDHSLRTRLQVSARQAALQYSWPRVTTVVARVYEHVAGQTLLQPCRC